MLKIADELPEDEKWKVTKTCWMDLELDDNPVGRIEIALFGEIAPITVSNFAALCKGNYNHDVSYNFLTTSVIQIIF